MTNELSDPIWPVMKRDTFYASHGALETSGNKIWHYYFLLVINTYFSPQVSAYTGLLQRKMHAELKFKFLVMVFSLLFWAEDNHKKFKDQILLAFSLKKRGTDRNLR